MAVALLWCQGQAPVSIMNFQNFLLTRQRDIFVHYRNNCFLKLPRIQINFFNNNDGSCSDGIWHVLPWLSLIVLQTQASWGTVFLQS